MSSSRARSRGAAWWAAGLLGALACGCRSPLGTAPASRPAAGELESARRDDAAVREALAPRRRASGPVTIRLTALAQARELELVDGAGRRVLARREGGELRLEDGTSRAELRLAGEPSRPVGVGAARYAGALRVRVDRGGEWLVENELDLEDYVSAVVAKELGFGESPPEAWRAQAIAARSYAVANLEQRGASRPDPYLFDGVRDQAYAGIAQPRNARERASLAELERAVASTRGLLLVEGDASVDARYHSSCGGRTADGRAVFPELRSGVLRSVPCEPCAGRADAAWSWTVPREDLAALARRRGLGQRILRVAPTQRDESGRWLEVELTGDAVAQRLRYEEFRRELGRDKLRSALIVDTWPKPGSEIEGGLLVRGAGHGHGAGLCQRGALELARRGWNAERVLGHYYPGSRIEDRR